ncbi:SEC-C metal-binding domain-containing protein [Fodinicola acaciae]|uniref:SEC-C metal-binding domain-containing protein n=1 Tax=Fodinicola acaciae TaxID=2681555 RepID=UPI001C9E5ADE|nr:SEC-C metal-binding domain-containing protein [Fodinicola acaciae]
MSETDIGEAIRRILITDGPATDDDLVERLTADGVDLGPHPEDTLLDALEAMDHNVVMLVDDRSAWAPQLLAGRVFTHRLSEWEIERDTLALDPDLTAVIVTTEIEGGDHLADGSAVTVVTFPMDAGLVAERGIPDGEGSFFLLLPRGHLAGMGLRGGDLVGVRRVEAGIALEKVDEDTVSTDTAALGGALTALLDDRHAVDLQLAIVTTCANDPSLFTQPLPPLGTTLPDLGFIRYGDWLQLAMPPEEVLSHRYGLDEKDARSAAAIISHFQRGEPGEDDLLLGMSDSAVAEAVLLELQPADPDRLHVFAESVGQRLAAVGHWLHGRAYELDGDVIAAENALLAAEKLDSQWEPIVSDLLYYANDRGNAARGLELLRRLGSGHPLSPIFQKFQPQPRPDLGRNKPCWCGSGRKYKACHLRSEILPLDVRASWLYQKAEVFQLDNIESAELLQTLAYRRARHSGWHEDPLPADAMLFEGGMFARFLAVRGALLPADEHILAEQWLLVERSVHQIKHIRPGRGLTMRDLRTGDVHEVRERTASRTLRTGDLVCCRVVPAGDTMQIFGGIEPVSLGQRDKLIELLDRGPAAEELVDFLTARFAPPQLVNTDGDPLMVREATLAVTDRNALRDALDRAYERNDDGSDEWMDFNNTQHIRATLHLDTQLRVSTNSENRLDRVLDQLRTLDPSLVVVDQSRESMDDVRTTTAPSLPAYDTETAHILEQHVREYERKWLDEPIPALSGHTPREAAADPTRRDDLTRLLDSFPDDESNPGATSPRRLRAALNL